MKILAIILALCAGVVAFPAGKTSPGGLDGSVQFNDIDTFGGDFAFRYDKVSRRVIINGGMLDLSGSVVRTFIPDGSDLYDLGSESNNFAGLYLGNGEVIHFGNLPVLWQEANGVDTYINANGAVRIVRPLILNNLPTFDPQSPGHVWSDNGYLRVSQ